MRYIIPIAVACFLGACQQTDDLPAFVLGDGSEGERQAFEILEERAEAGDIDARYQLVWFGSWAERHYDEAIPELRQLAGEGSARAAMLLARAYQHGIGVAQDYHEAARWLEVAASLGDETAQQELQHFKAFTGAPDRST